MTVLFPTSVDEAVSALADPGVQVLAGGTDFMVEVNAGRRRPETVLSLGRIPALREWSCPEDAGDPAGPVVRLGATVTYTELLSAGLAPRLPALAHAARTVGSPQIRNAGTVGGNLATASPAGDTLPVLAALEAVVEVAGPGGVRLVAVADFITGPKCNALEPGELVVAVRVPVLDGHQEYRKVGVRNAMVIAVASSWRWPSTATARTVRCALGSVGPGSRWAGRGAGGVAGRGHRLGTAARFTGRPGRRGPNLAGALVAGAARPIDDHRGTAAYRRHAVGVMAARAAALAWGSL